MINNFSRTPQHRKNNKGFSLVELIVVIAIMAVLVIILAPMLLRYNESSRAERDNSAMDEVVNSIQLALADQEIYDEVVRHSTTDNVSCYVDTASEANYKKVVTKDNQNGIDQYTFTSDARQLDETAYYAAGNMRGVTITFAPYKNANKSTFDLKQGVVNQYVQVSGNKRFGAMTNLYARTRSSIGDSIEAISQTYRNSEFTVFIGIGTTGGNDARAQDAIRVYGQWSGTNLPADGTAYLIVIDRITGDEDATIEIDDNKWNETNGNKITVNPGDLNGGGAFSSETESGNQTDEPVENNNYNEKVPDDQVGKIYAYLTEDTNNWTLILRNTPLDNVDNIRVDYGLIDDTSDTPAWVSQRGLVYNVDFQTPIAPRNCKNWFMYSNGLKSINNMHNFDTSNVTDMSGMFFKCDKLQTIDISGWDMRNVETTYRMFSKCAKLTEVNANGCVMNKNTNAAEMFYQCPELLTVSMNGCELSSVESTKSMFYSCSKLKTVNMSDWNFGSCKDMSNMFDSCTALTDLHGIETIDTGNVANMSAVFSSCRRLTSLNLSNWNTSSVTEINGMFYYCSFMETLNLSGWDLSQCTNMKMMFYMCEKLQSISGINDWVLYTGTINKDLMFSNVPTSVVPSWY